jgi:acyl-CoA synthetase (AMP-forming)/AMP-acid ligase II
VTATQPLHTLLDYAVEHFPGAPAVSDRTDCWTYAQLHRHSRALAGWLRRHGLSPGDRVLVQLDASREFAALLFAASYAAVVLAPVSPGLPPFQLSPLLADADPAMILLSRRPGPIDHRLGTGTPIAQCPRPEELPDTGSRPVPGADQTRTALLLYTSGSTALPRAVVCPHRMVMFVTRAVGRCLGYRAGDVVLSCLPPAFDYGLYQILLATAAGAHLVFARPGEAPALSRLLDTHRPTIVPVVPPLAEALVRLGSRPNAPTGHRIRLFTNTGAALHPLTAHALRQRFPGARVVSMYGATECKRITIGEPDEDRYLPGSVGRPLPGTRVSIVLDDRTVPAGVTGEVVVQGPNVMAGYWRDERRTAAVFGTGPRGAGILRTGDYGRLDAGGRLYLTGRRDELYQQGAVRTSALEVEWAALDIPTVRQAALLVPTAGRGAVLAVASTEPPAQVLRQLAHRLEQAKLPDSCAVFDRLPSTARGKIDKTLLHRMVAAGEQVAAGRRDG